MVRKVINKDMPQGGCDCYLVDRKAIEVLKLMDEKNSSLTLQVMWLGFQTEKIYFDRKDRTVGKSRWTFHKKFKLVVDSMMSFTYFPIRVMEVCGVLFFLAALVGTILVIRERIVSDQPIAGYASMMCVELFSFGMIMLVLGLLGEYIWRTLEETKKRPPFIIDVINKDDRDNGNEGDKK